MEKLKLDLETLEVECLDVTVTGLGGGLEAFGMGHAATELGQSCATSTDCTAATCACSTSDCTASCVAEECHCSECASGK